MSPSPSYAEGTLVPVQRTINELDALLARFGAGGFIYGRDEEQGISAVAFKLNGRQVRFTVALPSSADYMRSPTGRPRSPSSAAQVADAELRRRWRVKVMLVKALLVAVAEGGLSMDEAFLPHVVLAGGRTVAEWATPQLNGGAAELGPLLPGWLPAGALDG